MNRASEQDDAVTIRARFASRRAGWNDNYSCQVWLPDGRTCACGAPTPEQASEGAEKWAAQMLGRPVRLLFMKRQPRRTDKGRQKGGDA